MRCQDALVDMSAALDGELEAAGATSLREHLAGCPSCQAQQAQLQALDPLLRAPALRAVSVPEELRGRIASQIARPVPPPRRRASPLAFAVAFTGAAAAAAAIAMAGPTADQEPLAGDDATAALPAGDDAMAALPAAGPDPGAGSSLDSTQNPGRVSHLPRSDRAPAARGQTRHSLGAGGRHQPGHHPRHALARHDCRLAVAGDSPIARACGAGGTAAARRAMQGLVEAARARGVRFECRDCHRNEIDFQLDTDARERFASLLAVVGA